MYYNSSPPQESAMNLLISPFEPNQLSYPSNNYQFTNDNNQFEYGNDQFDYSSQPLNAPMQHSDPLDYLNTEGMSPVALTTDVPMSARYNRSLSPQADMVRIDFCLLISLVGFFYTNFFFNVEK